MRARPGFTLVEIVVVILILTVLAALLMPALTGAQRSARRAKAVAEITQLASALELFKSTYGMYPPSYIVLRESDAYDMGNPDHAHSVRMLRRLWPNISLNIGGSGSHSWDINRNGDDDDTITLRGAECLVFFVGGVLGAQFDADSPASCLGIGFSKDPSNPFSTSTSASRYGPFFEFAGARFMNGVSDTELMPEYEDVFGNDMPLAYFSSYEGQGYQQNNVTWPGSPSWAYRTSTTVSPSCLQGPNPYVLNDKSTGECGVLADYDSGDPDDTPLVTYWKRQSYQIICAGEDGLFGAGGYYNPESAKGAGLASIADWDNLANFAEGALGGN